jgi:hypothetical protein
MLAKLKVALLAAMLVGLNTAAVAADYYVDITNRTGCTIM